MTSPETDPFAALAVDLAAEHKESKRQRRMARAPSFAATSIETPGFLKAKEEKPDIPDNAVISIEPPPHPNIGCAWHSPETKQTKYWHGTGWYLSPPALAPEREAEPEPAHDIADTLAALDGPLEAKFEPIDNFDDETFEADAPSTESLEPTTENIEVTTETADGETAELATGPDAADFVGTKKPADPEHGDKWWKGDGEMRWFWAVDEDGAEKNRWFQRPPAGHADYDAFYADTAKPEKPAAAPARSAPATVKEDLTVERAKPVPAHEPFATDEPETTFTIPAGAAIDLDDDELVTFADEPHYDFDTHSLVCGVRDAMIEQFKHRPKPWSALSQEEQRDMVMGLENSAEAMVRGVLEKLASHDDSSIRCLLESYQEKDGIKIVMKLQAYGDEESEKAILFLHRARGKTVMVRQAEVADYHGHMEAETLPDQAEIDWNAAPEYPYHGDDMDLAQG